jgi:hypothetical protein
MTMFECGSAAHITAGHLKRVAVTYPMQVGEGKQFVRIAMDKKFQRLMADTGGGEDGFTTANVFTEMIKLRDAAFLREVERHLNDKVNAEKVRWTYGKVHAAAMQCALQPHEIQMPDIGGVEGVKVCVLLGIPGSGSPHGRVHEIDNRVLVPSCEGAANLCLCYTRLGRKVW